MKLISDLHLDNLIAFLLKKNGLSFNAGSGYVEAFEEEFNIDIDSFKRIASQLIYLTKPLHNELTDTKYHMFGFLDGNHFMTLAKLKLEQENGK